jgi:putative restriction endonuclease
MFAIAPTDLDWFYKLRVTPTDRAVNFWTPTPWSVKGLNRGDRLYFMLKAPIRKIGGYGVFSRYVDMTAAEAWDTYGLGNGVESKDELVAKIDRFVAKNARNRAPVSNPTIGCIELEDAVMLDDDRCFDPEPLGHSFPPQIVKLKYFHAHDNLMMQLRERSITKAFEIVTGEASRKAAVRKERKGQCAFRKQVLQNYGYRCAVYGETVTPLLEAAHIQPYINEQSNHAQNGICLRVDVHRLFDEGLIAIADDLTIMVSSKLSKTSYAELQGRRLALPLDLALRPSADAITFHRRSFRDEQIM